MSGINTTLEVVLVVHSETSRDRTVRGQGGFLDIDVDRFATRTPVAPGFTSCTKNHAITHPNHDYE